MHRPLHHRPLRLGYVRNVCRLLDTTPYVYGCDITMNGLYWMVWVLYVKRACAMVLLMQLKCEFAILTAFGRFIFEQNLPLQTARHVESALATSEWTVHATALRLAVFAGLWEETSTYKHSMEMHVNTVTRGLSSYSCTKVSCWFVLNLAKTTVWCRWAVWAW